MHATFLIKRIHCGNVIASCWIANITFKPDISGNCKKDIPDEKALFKNKQKLSSVVCWIKLRVTELIIDRVYL